MSQPIRPLAFLHACQISTRFVSIKLKDFNSDSSKWLRCGEQGLVPDGLRRIVQLAWSNPQVRPKHSLFVKHVQCLCGTGGVKTW